MASTVTNKAMLVSIKSKIKTSQSLNTKILFPPLVDLRLPNTNTLSVPSLKH